MQSRLSTLIAISLAAVLLIAPILGRTALARNPDLRIPKVRRASEIVVDSQSKARTPPPRGLATIEKRIPFPIEPVATISWDVAATSATLFAHGSVVGALSTGRQFSAGSSPLRC